MKSVWKTMCVEILGTLVIVGCADRLQDPKMQSSQTQTLSSEVVLPRNIRPEERIFADLSASAPSAGGFYRDAAGTIHLYVRDSKDIPRARAQVSSLTRGPLQRVGGNASVVIERGKYTFSELAITRDSVSSAIFDVLEGMVDLDLDEAKNRVVIGIDASQFELVKPIVRKKIVELGLDTAMILLSPVTKSFPRIGPVNNAEDAPFTPGATLHLPFDSLVGGLRAVMYNNASTPSSSPNGTCTIGFAATRNGVSGFVLPTHCSTTWGGLDASVARRADTTLLAQEYYDPPLNSCSSKVCRNSDATFFATITGINLGLGLVAKPSTGTTVNTSDPYYTIVNSSSMWIGYGDIFFMVGQTSGRQTGVVTGTCVDHIDGSHKTVCAYTASIYSAGGDSGAPILYALGEDKFALQGLWFAGNGTMGYFSTITRIKTDIGGTLDISRGYQLATPTISGAVVGGYPQVSWGAVSGATRYNVYCEWTQIEYDEYNFPYTVYHYDFIGQTTSTSLTDTVPVDYYTGIGISTGNYRAYHVYAASGSDVSLDSSLAAFSWY